MDFKKRWVEYNLKINDMVIGTNENIPHEYNKIGKIIEIDFSVYRSYMIQYSNGFRPIFQSPRNFRLYQPVLKKFLKEKK